MRGKETKKKRRKRDIKRGSFEENASSLPYSFRYSEYGNEPFVEVGPCFDEFRCKNAGALMNWSTVTRLK